MKYLDEFRDGKAAKKLSEGIKSVVTKPWQIMEICGGQTHSILKYSIEELLPEEISLIHGPGCPVCVTPLELIDKAIAIAQRDDVIFTSFGDMLRVPGSKYDLLSVKAQGGNVKMVYSPLDAVKLAENNQEKKVVFFAVGFETTAPANAMSVIESKRKGLTNYSILCSHVLVPPAIDALLSSKNNNIQGFLAAGHVCTVMGYEEYIPLAEKYKIPIVVTGSMKNSLEPGWDGSKNLVDSIQVCLNENSRGMGVLVCLNGEVNAASEVTKIYSNEIESFQSLDFGALGFVQSEKVIYNRLPQRLEILKTKKINTNVDLLTVYVGMDEKFFKYSADSDAEGLVIEALGIGNVPPKAFKGIKLTVCLRCGCMVALPTKPENKVLSDFSSCNWTS